MLWGAVRYVRLTVGLTLRLQLRTLRPLQRVREMSVFGIWVAKIVDNCKMPGEM